MAHHQEDPGRRIAVAINSVDHDPLICYAVALAALKKMVDADLAALGANAPYYLNRISVNVDCAVIAAEYAIKSKKERT